MQTNTPEPTQTTIQSKSQLKKYLTISSPLIKNINHFLTTIHIFLFVMLLFTFLRGYWKYNLHNYINLVYGIFGIVYLLNGHKFYYGVVDKLWFSLVSGFVLVLIGINLIFLEAAEGFFKQTVK